MERLLVRDGAGGHGHADLVALAGKTRTPVRVEPAGVDAEAVNFTGGTSGMSKGWCPRAVR